MCRSSGASHTHSFYGNRENALGRTRDEELVDVHRPRLRPHHLSAGAARFIRSLRRAIRRDAYWRADAQNWGKECNRMRHYSAHFVGRSGPAPGRCGGSGRSPGPLWRSSSTAPSAPLWWLPADARHHRELRPVPARAGCRGHGRGEAVLSMRARLRGTRVRAGAPGRRRARGRPGQAQRELTARRDC